MHLLHKLLFFSLFSLLMTAQKTQASVPVALFGTAEFRAETHAALPKWDNVLDAIISEQKTYNACRQDRSKCPNRAVMAWQSLLAGLEGAPVREQVTKVNRFINQWTYKTDQVNFGKSDYWATPLEFMSHSGDCEDYAITKYVSLRLLGVPAENLRLVVLQDTLRDIAHAVLAVYIDGSVLILDNVTNATLEHDRIFQYNPYYSVNEQARWAHVPAGSLILSGSHQNKYPSRQ